MKRALAIVLLLAPGCAGQEDHPPPGDAELYAGSAAQDGTGFVEVSDGQEVELIPGAQGGFHVWINVRVHAAAGELFVTHEARRVDDDALVLRGLPQPLEVPDSAMDDWWESPAAGPAFMCPAPLGLQVFDQAIEYTVRLTTEDEQVLAEDQVILEPHCPAGDQNAFCLEICAG
ncbi:MAG TPA: hypothetical protein VL172_03815 [Kofleriaceae bacterium]|jgi:hypothetical protein|nr:hypothetical protein [Kofleriaceae bacterium]